MATKRNRVGGVFTTFNWNGKLIASARQVSHTSPTPVADVVPIQSLDSVRPSEIITPAAIGMGELSLELYEAYGQKVWEGLVLASGVSLSSRTHIDLADIFKAVADTDAPITISKVITPPGGADTSPYTETYHGVVIASVQDGETIAVDTMQILKQINVAYTYVTSSLRA